GCSTHQRRFRPDVRSVWCYICGDRFASTLHCPWEKMMVALEPALAVKPVDAATRAHWEALYIAHHQVVWRTLRRIGFSPDAAAEATQQAFLICVQRYEDVRPGSERAFLFSTAIRVAKTVARKHRRISLEEDLEHPDLGMSAEALDRRELAVKI